MKKITLIKRVHKFILPDISRTFILRLFFVAIAAYFLFAYIFIPLKINGHSMAPTYTDGQVNICFRLTYLFSKPERFDVVVVRYAGTRVMLLKRVVGLEGEQVAFQDGRLLINGKVKEEPYVRAAYHWNLPPRKVEKGKIYIVGDNRNVPMAQHDFGQTSIKRVIGAPLW